MARSGGRSPFQRTTLRAVQQELARGWPVGLTVLTGDDLYHLDQVQRTLLRELVPGEASEFALTVYGEQRVDIPTVVAAGSAVLSGWEVAVAIGRRDRSAALLALRHLLAAGDEPLRLIGGVAFRVRGMLQARAMIERGVGAAQAVRASRLWGDATSHVVAGLQRYSLAELLAFPALLLAADRTLKSRAVAPLAVLESMLDRMLLPATPLEARRP